MDLQFCPECKTLSMHWDTRAKAFLCLYPGCAASFTLDTLHATPDARTLSLPIDLAVRLVEAAAAVRCAMLGWADNGEQFAHARELADRILSDLGVIGERSTGM